MKWHRFVIPSLAAGLLVVAWRSFEQTPMGDAPPEARDLPAPRVDEPEPSLGVAERAPLYDRDGSPSLRRLLIEVRHDGSVQGADVRVLAWTPPIEQAAGTLAGLGADVLGGVLRARTDDSGVAEIRAPDDALFVAAWLPPFAPAGLVVPRGTPAIVLTLAEGHAVRGSVRLAGGGVPPGAWVRARRAVAWDFLMDGLRLEPARVAGMLFEARQEAFAADGRFELMGLPAGRILLEAGAPGCSTDGVSFADLPTDDAFDLVLHAGATVTGRVLDEATGEPLAGVQVSGYVELSSFENSLGPTTWTGPDGSFVLDGMRARAPGTYVLAMDPGHASTCTAVPDLAPGERRQVIVRMPRAVDIAGRVVRDSGEPLAGVEVALWEEVTGREVGSTRSAENGRFACAFARADTQYLLFAQHEGFAPATVHLKHEAEPAAVEIRMAPLVTIHGRVLADGRPATSGQVRLLAEMEDARPVLELLASIDGATGAFRFAGVAWPSVPVRLTALVRDFAPTTLMVPEAMEPDDPPLDIHLERGIPLGGSVLDAETRLPVPGARIRLVDFTRFGFNMRTPLPVEAETDASGTFRLGNVPPGAVDLGVLVDAPGYAREVESVLVPKDAPATTVTVLVERGATLEVQVWDLDGTPLRGFELYLEGPNREHQRLAFPEARATLLRVEPGPCLLGLGIWTHPEPVLNGTIIRRSIELTAGATHREDFHLGAGGRVHGTIHVPPSVRGRRFNAYVLGAGSYEVWREVDLSGRYDLRFVTPGRKQVLIETADGVPRLEERAYVDVVEGGDHVRDFTFPGSGVTGRVVDARGSPVAGAWVSFQPAAATEGDPPRRYGSSTSDDGTFAALGLPSGAYAYAAQARGFGLSEGAVLVPPEDRTADLDVVLLPEARLRVAVDDRSGERVPLPDIRLRHPARGSARHKPAGLEDGRWHVIRNLTTAEYVLHVRAEGCFPIELPVVCRSAETVDVTVALRRLGDLEVDLRDAVGQPLAAEPFILIDDETGTNVAAWRDAGLIAGHGPIRSDEDGRARLEDLPEGSYTLHALGQSRPVTVTAGGEVRVRIQRLP